MIWIALLLVGACVAVFVRPTDSEPTAVERERGEGGDRSPGRRSYRRGHTAQLDRTIRLLPIEKRDLPVYERETAKEFYFQSELSNGSQVYVGVSRDNPWIDIYARKRRQHDGERTQTGDFARFGFTRDRYRWSYGSGPPSAGEIRDVVEAVAQHLGL